MDGPYGNGPINLNFGDYGVGNAQTGFGPPPPPPAPRGPDPRAAGSFMNYRDMSAAPQPRFQHPNVRQRTPMHIGSPADTGARPGRFGGPNAIQEMRMGLAGSQMPSSMGPGPGDRAAMQGGGAAAYNPMLPPPGPPRMGPGRPMSGAAMSGYMGRPMGQQGPALGGQGGQGPGPRMGLGGTPSGLGPGPQPVPISSMARARGQSGVV